MILTSCDPSKGKVKKLDQENLELSADNPQKIEVIVISDPDSAFERVNSLNLHNSGIQLSSWLRFPVHHVQEHNHVTSPRLLRKKQADIDNY